MVLVCSPCLHEIFVFKEQTWAVKQINEKNDLDTPQPIFSINSLMFSRVHQP